MELGPVILATTNQHKVGEIRTILSGWDLLARPDDVPDVDETEETFIGNARLKAVALARATGRAAVADDSGIEVDALDGHPGVRSGRYAGEQATDEQNVVKLLASLEGLPEGQRTARMRTVALLSLPDGTEFVGDGTVEGVLVDTIRGSNGFGYDVIFVPTEGDGRTFAEMSAEEKHALSHRGRAFAQLARAVDHEG